jgi:hypothetical protein
MKHEYTCKNDECQHEFIVNCYDGSGCFEEECPKCHEEVDTEEVENECFPPRDPDWYEEFDR